MRKTTLFLLLAALTLSGVMVSCQKVVQRETPVSIALYTKSMDKPVGAEAGTLGVTVSATVDGWTAESDADWLQVDVETPTLKGVREVKLTYSANTGAQRTAHVVFSVPGYSETYTLSQSGQ